MIFGGNRRLSSAIDSNRASGAIDSNRWQSVANRNRQQSRVFDCIRSIAIGGIRLLSIAIAFWQSMPRVSINSKSAYSFVITCLAFASTFS